MLGFGNVPKAVDATPDVDCAAIADEDGDCVADTIDNCPATPNADGSDGDADGVGDACDPHPGDPHDTILGFWSFLGDGATDMAAWPNEDPQSTSWSYPGTGTIVHTSLGDSVAEVISQSDYDSSELTVEAGFTFHTWVDAGTSVAMAVHLDSPFNVGGHVCFVTPYNNNDPALDNVYLEDAGTKAIATGVPALQDGNRVVIRLRRAAVPATLQCQGAISDHSFDTGVIGIATAAQPGDHRVGIQSAFTSSEVRYVVVYGRKP